MAIVRGAKVRAHVQAFCDEVERRFGIVSFGTYPGHDGGIDLAVDCFGTQEQMAAVAEWANDRPVMLKFGIRYIIFNINKATPGGEIWNPEIAEMWRQMANRGSPTNNHWDHDHVTFYDKVKGVDYPELLLPNPAQGILRKEEEVMIIRPGEALPYPIPAGAKNVLVSCEMFGQDGGCKAAIIIGNHPAYRGAFGPEVVTVGQGTSKAPVKSGDAYFRVHNMGQVALTVGAEF